MNELQERFDELINQRRYAIINNQENRLYHIEVEMKDLLETILATKEMLNNFSKSLKRVYEYSIK